MTDGFDKVERLNELIEHLNENPDDVIARRSASDLIESDDDLCESYLDHTELDSLLTWHFRASDSAAGTSAPDLNAEPTAQASDKIKANVSKTRGMLRVRGMKLRVMVVLAGLAMVAVISWLVFRPNTEPIGYVMSCGAATASTGVELGVGCPVKADMISVEKGDLHVVLANGNDVRIAEGTQIRFMSTNAARLDRGAVTVESSGQGKDFVINAGGLSVTHVGTRYCVGRFGNEVNVGVMEGKVRCSWADRDTQDQPVVVGEWKRFNLDDQAVTQVAEDASLLDSFSDLTELHCAGQIKVLPTAPESLLAGRMPNQNDLNVFLEREDLELEVPLQVNVTEPGVYDSRNRARNPMRMKSEIPAGSVISSYFVHVDEVRDRTQPRLTGTLYFPTEIVGIITRVDLLGASDPVLSRRETEYHPYRIPQSGLESVEAERDWLILSEDRRSLMLSCYQGPHFDQLRIITAGNAR